MDITQIYRNQARVLKADNSYIISLLVMVSFLFSCNTNQDPIVKETYYSNGVLESRIEYKNDSLRQGKALVYYPNGQLKRDGYYVNGKRYGRSISYYESGQLKGEEYYDNGELFGNSYDYYENGRILRYNAFDYEGATFYVLKYDSLGNKIKEEGLVIANKASTSLYKDIYSVNDSIILFYVISEPPGYKPKASIGVYRIDTNGNRLEVIQPSSLYPIENSVIKYRNVFRAASWYEFVCVGELYDTLHKWSKIDSTVVKIKVVDKIVSASHNTVLASTGKRR